MPRLAGHHAPQRSLRRRYVMAGALVGFMLVLGVSTTVPLGLYLSYGAVRVTQEGTGVSDRNASQTLGGTTADRNASETGHDTWTVEQELAPTVATGTEDLLLQEQLKDLFAVGCKPSQVVVEVLDLLSPDDDLWDKTFSRQWVVVDHCMPALNHCGSGRSCLPTAGSQRKKVFVVQVTRDDRRIEYHQRHVVEHTACSCVV